MATAFHVTQISTAGSIESSVRQGQAAGFIADADLATDLPTILAAIDTRVAASATASSVVNKGLVLALKDAVRKGFLLQGATLWIGGSLAAIYADIDQNWAPGFPVTI
jgi:hypothetical protein